MEPLKWQSAVSIRGNFLLKPSGFASMQMICFHNLLYIYIVHFLTRSSLSFILDRKLRFVSRSLAEGLEINFFLKAIFFNSVASL